MHNQIASKGASAAALIVGTIATIIHMTGLGMTALGLSLGRIGIRLLAWAEEK
jgi:hypothetical protein